MDKKGVEYQHFPPKMFVSECRKYSELKPLCCVSENFWYRKCLDKKGGVSRYSVEVFCFTVPKNFVWESFTVAIVSGTENIWIRGGGGYRDFPSEFFVSQCCKFS